MKYEGFLYFILSSLLITGSAAEASDSKWTPSTDKVVEIQHVLMNNVRWYPWEIDSTRNQLMETFDAMFPQSGARELNQKVKWERRAAAASALMIRWDSLSLNSDGSYDLLHMESPYCDFPGYFASPSKCSGFLATSTKVVTAAHCLSENALCEDYGFVFGLVGSDEAAFRNIPASQVRRCKSEVARGKVGEDGWLVLELDKATSVEPLALESRSATRGKKVVMVGHPLGLPAKVAEGVVVKSSSCGSFESDLDGYQGGSGAPVFRKRSIFRREPKVLGFLVDGEKSQPYYSNVGKCSDALMPCSPLDAKSCQGTRIIEASEFVQALFK